MQEYRNVGGNDLFYEPMTMVLLGLGGLFLRKKK